METWIIPLLFGISCAGGGFTSLFVWLFCAKRFGSALTTHRVPVEADGKAQLKKEFIKWLFLLFLEGVDLALDWLSFNDLNDLSVTIAVSITYGIVLCLATLFACCCFVYRVIMMKEIVLSYTYGVEIPVSADASDLLQCITKDDLTHSIFAVQREVRATIGIVALACIEDLPLLVIHVVSLQRSSRISLIILASSLLSACVVGYKFSHFEKLLRLRKVENTIQKELDRAIDNEEREEEIRKLEIGVLEQLVGRGEAQFSVASPNYSSSTDEYAHDDSFSLSRQKPAVPILNLSGFRGVSAKETVVVDNIAFQYTSEEEIVDSPVKTQSIPEGLSSFKLMADLPNTSPIGLKLDTERSRSATPLTTPRRLTNRSRSSVFRSCDSINGHRRRKSSGDSFVRRTPSRHQRHRSEADIEWSSDTWTVGSMSSRHSSREGSIVHGSHASRGTPKTPPIYSQLRAAQDVFLSGYMGTPFPSPEDSECSIHTKSSSKFSADVLNENDGLTVSQLLNNQSHHSGSLTKSQGVSITNLLAKIEQIDRAKTGRTEGAMTGQVTHLASSQSESSIINLDFSKSSMTQASAHSDDVALVTLDFLKSQESERTPSPREDSPREDSPRELSTSE